MTGRSGYRTRQKEELTEYLMKREGTHLTAAQIHDDFRAMGLNMGMATIYRHLDKLVEEGTVRKYTIGATNS
ncbi:MAG: transcriptional repressor, partial [Lachnospiraceae bacterium]|nr:transcriptional repressor [Lachnospiraceae bacterium]